MRRWIVLLAMAAAVMVPAGCASTGASLSRKERAYVGTYQNDPTRSYNETVALAKRDGRIANDAKPDDPGFAMIKKLTSLGDGAGSITIALGADGNASALIENPFGENVSYDGPWEMNGNLITLGGLCDGCSLQGLNGKALMLSMGDVRYVLTKR